MTIYFKKHDNILICREKKHLIFKNLESYPNLAWAEYLPPWAFLDFFCKISTPEPSNPVIFHHYHEYFCFQSQLVWPVVESLVTMEPIWLRVRHLLLEQVKLLVLTRFAT